METNIAFTIRMKQFLIFNILHVYNIIFFPILKTFIYDNTGTVVYGFIHRNSIVM